MTVRWKAVDRTIAVLSGVIVRKLALPDVAEMLSSWSEFISPGIKFLFEAATRGVLPLRLGRARTGKNGLGNCARMGCCRLTLCIRSTTRAGCRVAVHCPPLGIELGRHDLRLRLSGR